MSGFSIWSEFHTEKHLQPDGYKFGDRWPSIKLVPIVPIVQHVSAQLDRVESPYSCFALRQWMLDNVDQRRVETSGSITEKQTMNDPRREVVKTSLLSG